MTRFDDPVPILLAHELFTNTHIVHELSRIGKVSSKRAVQASSVIFGSSSEWMYKNKVISNNNNVGVCIHMGQEK